MIDTGRPMTVVAGEIGVEEQLLGGWVAIERSGTDDLLGIWMLISEPNVNGSVESSELRMGR